MSRNNYDLRNDPDFKQGVDLWTPNKRRGCASAVPAGTTCIVSNFPAFAFTNFTGTGSAGNADSPGGSFINCISGVNEGDASGFVTAGAVGRRNWSPWTQFEFCAGNVLTTVRWWVGLFASEPSALANLSSISAACFGYDTAVDGTAYWRCESANASTTQKTTTTIPVVANGHYTGAIRMDNTNSQVQFFMAYHGLLTASKAASPLKLVANHAVSVPVAATPLLAGLTVTTKVVSPATGARRIVVGRVDVSQD